MLLVSFNTKGLLDRCFDAIRRSAGSLSYEIIVVDNASRDGSEDYLRQNHPTVKVIQAGANLGFGNANNLGLPEAKGEFLLLLNTDAFLVDDALERSVKRLKNHPEVGMVGARLTGEAGEWQPSARSFPTVTREWMVLSGLSGKFPKHPWFGQPDLTHLDQSRDLVCDWVPGAFALLPMTVVKQVGLFDPRFFLYSEEVDLCFRIKQAGKQVVYWPDVHVIHIGGASAATFSEKLVSKSGKQMQLWQLQSQFLFYRKNYGAGAAKRLRRLWKVFNGLRAWSNARKNPTKAEESRVLLALIDRAWTNTKGGQVSPPQPWGAE